MIITFPLAVAATVGLVLWIFHLNIRTDDLDRPTRVSFLFALSVTAIAATVCGFFVLQGLRQVVFWESIFAVAFRLFVLLLIIHWIGGRLSFSFAIEAAQAKKMVDVLDQQRTLLIQADERVRREIADYLHDHVQADLLVAAMKLRELSGNTSTQDRSNLSDMVNELERIRRVGVRGASRRLSPDVSRIGIYPALLQLVDVWSPAMEVTLNVSADAQRRLVDQRVPTRLLLALYRITEQSLLNAAAHGSSQHTTVDIWIEDERVLLTITDNGSGMSPNPQPGTGTAVCDAWVELLGGHWERSSLSHGVQVSVQLPITTNGTEPTLAAPPL